MKDKFLRHKKKIIIAILTIAAALFNPIAPLLPIADQVIPADQVQHEQK